MDKRQKISKMKYLTVFSITTLIFIVGILVGNFITNVKMNDVVALEQTLRIDTMSMEVQNDLISNDPCKFNSEDTLSDSLFQLGSKLDHMQKIKGESDSSIERLKEYYFMLEIRHSLLIEQIKETCGKDLDIIYYFYSEEKNCPKCTEQGYALTYLRRDMPSTRVYAFDYDYENVALDTLKRLYEINNAESLPVLIINGETHYGFMNQDEIKELIE